MREAMNQQCALTRPPLLNQITRVLERTVMYGKAYGNFYKANVSFLRTGSHERFVGR